MNNWETLANDEIVNQTANALTANGMKTFITQTAEEAKKKFFEILPAGASVMNMTSVTLNALGIAKEITESGKYDSVRNKLMKLDRKTQSREMQKLGAAPDWAVGSIHALTQDGKVIIASRGGSQMPAYVYGAGHVIWVVGTQKIVKNTDEGIKRIYDYCLPLETERVKVAYGMPFSEVNKLLIINKESLPDRITLILVKEKLGY